jgi:hypothetical protein
MSKCPSAPKACCPPRTARRVVKRSPTLRFRLWRLMSAPPRPGRLDRAALVEACACRIGMAADCIAEVVRTMVNSSPEPAAFEVTPASKARSPIAEDKPRPLSITRILAICFVLRGSRTLCVNHVRVSRLLNTRENPRALARTVLAGHPRLRGEIPSVWHAPSVLAPRGRWRVVLRRQRSGAGVLLSGTPG